MAARYSKLPTDEGEMETDLPSIVLPDNHGDMYKSIIDYGSAFSYAKYNSLNEGRYFSYNRSAQRFKFDSNRRNVIKENLNELSGAVSKTITESVVIVLCYFIMAVTVPFSLLLCLKFIQRFERLIIFRVGRVQKPKGPGAVIVLPCIDTWQRVDLRTKAFNVPPVQSVTRDGGVLELGASVYYHIKDALAVVVSVQDWNLATRTLAHTMLHTHINRKAMSDVVSEQRTFESDLVAELNQSTLAWGMEITEVKLSDIKTIKKAEEPAQSLIKNLTNPEVAKELFRSLSSCSDYMELQQALTKTITGAAKPEPLRPEDFKNKSEKNDPTSLSVPAPGPAQNPFALAADNLTLDLEKLLNTLSSICSEKIVADVGYVYQINCAGAGDFYMDLKNGAGWIEQGQTPSTITPDITIELASQDLLALILGLMSPWDAYNTGRVKVSGNVYAATKLQVLAKVVTQHLSGRNSQQCPLGAL